MKSVIWNSKVIYPSKIVCVGRNYVDHIKELNNEASEEPVVFIKPNSSISNEIYSNKNHVIHYEGELTFLISSGEIRGVGFGIDLTKRELQTKLKAHGLPWERAKSFDNSAVFSKFVTFSNISKLRLELYLNGSLVQYGSCELMLNKPNFLLSDTKRFISFEDGDLLMTGTPKGVGQVNSGDKYLGKIIEKEKTIVEGSWVVK
jgi:2-keto-4-pentenoate hydratase/2-oxohepta-3-ene-1,7-dioic acid hydratase in catechol pathway